MIPGLDRLLEQDVCFFQLCIVHVLVKYSFIYLSLIAARASKKCSTFVTFSSKVRLAHFFKALIAAMASLTKKSRKKVLETTQ